MHFKRLAYTVALVLGLGLASTGYSQSFLTNGLVAYYPFNGNANDASGNGNTFSLIQTNIQYYDNINLGSYPVLRLNQSPACLVGTNALINKLTNYTFSVWLSPTTSSLTNTTLAVYTESQIYGDQSGGTTFNITYWPLMKKLYVYSGNVNNPSFWKSSAFTVTNVIGLHHYCITFEHTVADLGSLALYIDGNFLSVSTNQIERTSSGAVYKAIAEEACSVIASNKYGFWPGFQGDLGNMRVYSRALNAGEIGSLFVNDGPHLPTIITQPQSITTNQGANVSLSVSATGTNGVWYQWEKDGVNLPNATNNIYAITNAQPPSIGNYDVVVTGYGGSVTSSVVSLSLNGVNSALWQGLVAYYPFNGNADDASGFGDNGVVSNSVLATDRFGAAGKSYLFDGSSRMGIHTSGQYLPTEARPRSVSLWMLPSDLITNTGSYWIGGGLLQYGQSDGEAGLYAQEFVWQEAPHLVSFYLGTETVWGWNSWLYNWDYLSWHHAVWVYEGNTNSSLYIDGKKAALQSSSLGVTFNTKAGPLTIGAAGGRYFNGELDDVRIYNRALSSNEVAQLYATEAVPPTFTTQPYSVVAYAHTSASFNAAAAGSQPLSYQWTFYGTNLTKSTNDSITITNIQPANLGTYKLQVSNPAGSVTSSAATLFMYPYINTPFAGAVTYWGQSNTFSVGAWGNYLQYQWYLDGAEVPNATSPTLILPAIQFTSGGLYTVVVSSIFGSVTNTPVQVVVNPANVSLSLNPDLLIQGTVGYSYIIQCSTNLADTNSWITLTNLTLTQPMQYWDDTGSQWNQSRRYYRVLPNQ